MFDSINVVTPPRPS